MRCVIIAGSPETDSDFLRNTVLDSDFVICADLGYYFAKEAGIKPNIIVGDFDSYGSAPSADCEIIKLMPEKDDTDTVHSIDTALERGYRDFVILGALGGRLDHSIANISALQYIHTKGGRGTLLTKYERVEFLPRGEYVFNNLKNLTFSLFPFGCEEVCVSYEGAKYPLDKYCLRSSVPLGISNIFISDNAKINIYDGNAILIINISEEYI